MFNKKFWLLTIDGKTFPPFRKVEEVLILVARLKVEKFHLQSCQPTKRLRGIH